MVRLVFTLLVMTASQVVVADDYKFKCDKNVAFCEFDSRRITIGDKVAIFNAKDMVIAIGEVVR